MRPVVNSMRVPPSRMLFMNMVRKIAYIEGRTAFEQYHEMQRLGFSESAIARLLTPAVALGEIRKLTRDAFDEPAHASALTRCLFADISINLPGDMLAKLDRTSMQNSLEARCPLLDYRLVEHSFSIPDRFKMRGNRLKAILKETFEPRFPRGFLDKPKMGFGIPVGLFLRNELREKLGSIIKSDLLAASGLFNREYLKTLYEGHLSGLDHTFQLWPVYVFGVWLEKNQDRVIL